MLRLIKPFIENCWGHAMSKCCQYITNDTEAFVSLKSISIKECLIFCKSQSFRPKKVKKDDKNGKRLFWKHANLFQETFKFLNTIA
jgi:hypothetical protein